MAIYFNTAFAAMFDGSFLRSEFFDPSLARVYGFNSQFVLAAIQLLITVLIRVPSDLMSAFVYMQRGKMINLTTAE